MSMSEWKVRERYLRLYQVYRSIDPKKSVSGNSIDSAGCFESKRKALKYAKEINIAMNEIHK